MSEIAKPEIVVPSAMSPDELDEFVHSLSIDQSRIPSQAYTKGHTVKRLNTLIRRRAFMLSAAIDLKNSSLSTRELSELGIPSADLDMFQQKQRERLVQAGETKAGIVYDVVDGEPAFLNPLLQGSRQVQRLLSGVGVQYNEDPVFSDTDVQAQTVESIPAWNEYAFGKTITPSRALQHAVALVSGDKFMLGFDESRGVNVYGLLRTIGDIQGAAPITDEPEQLRQVTQG
ncbi:MAG: hypothetical protein AAB436_02450 [Patescibacteria group bacterium]